MCVCTSEDERRGCIHHSPHRGLYILYDPPISVAVKMMSKGVHNIAFLHTPDMRHHLQKA